MNIDIFLVTDMMFLGLAIYILFLTVVWLSTKDRD